MSENKSDSQLPSAEELNSTLLKKKQIALPSGEMFVEVHDPKTKQVLFELRGDRGLISRYSFSSLEDKRNAELFMKFTVGGEQGYQGKGYSTLLQKLVLRVLQERAIQKITGDIEINNLASFKELRKRTDPKSGKPLKIWLHPDAINIAKNTLTHGYKPENYGKELIPVETYLNETVESNPELDSYIAFLENFFDRNKTQRTL